MTEEDKDIGIKLLIAMGMGLFFGYFFARILWFYDPADQPVKTVNDVYVCTDMASCVNTVSGLGYS